MAYKQGNQHNHMWQQSSFIPVHALWICRDIDIIAESQIGTAKQNKKQTKFAKVFLEQVIKPAKPTTHNITANKNSNPSFTIYVKKRSYLFHILYDNDLTFLALTTNTLQQQPLDEIFDLLYNIKSAFLFDDGQSFSDTLGDLHHSYQLRARPKVSVVEDSYHNPFSDEEDQYHQDDDKGFNFIDGYSIGRDSDDEQQQQPNYTSLFTKKPGHSQPNYSGSQSQNGPNLNIPSPKKTTNHLQPQNSGSLSQSIPHNVHDLKLELPKTPTMSSRRQAIGHGDFMSSDDDHEQKFNDSRPIQLTFFILKRGWMTKLGNKFKTWRYRYFELWSNGLLNYFENEMKIKKKGSLNIMDEVLQCDLYERDPEPDNSWTVSNFFGGNNNDKQTVNNDDNNVLL